MKNFLFFISVFNCLMVFYPVLPVNAAVLESVKLENPLTVEAKPAIIIGLFIKAILGVVGGLALVMTVWGGFQWLTAAGNKERIDSGSKTMLWAIVGLVITLSSYLLVDTFMKFLSGGGG